MVDSMHISLMMKLMRIVMIGRNEGKIKPKRQMRSRILWCDRMISRE